MSQILARITKAATQPDRSLVEDAFGVAALFLLLFVVLSIPGFD